MVQTLGPLKNAAETPGRGHFEREIFGLLPFIVSWGGHFGENLLTGILNGAKQWGSKLLFQEALLLNVSLWLRVLGALSSNIVWSYHQVGIDIWDTIECYDATWYSYCILWNTLKYYIYVAPSLVPVHQAVVSGNRCCWCYLTRFPRCCVVTNPKTSVCNLCWSLFSLMAPFCCTQKPQCCLNMTGVRTFASSTLHLRRPSA